MQKKLAGAIEIATVIIIILITIQISSDIGRFSSYGYLGVFLIALVSTATIIFPSPGWAAVIAMSAYLDPLLIGIAAGTGAAIGELTGYFAGKGARDMLNNHVKQSKKIHELVKKYGAPGIFILSFIPNPLFDIAGIAAGSVKMHWLKFLMACALGRVLRYTLLAIAGAFTLGLIL